MNNLPCVDKLSPTICVVIREWLRKSSVCAGCSKEIRENEDCYFDIDDEGILLCTTMNFNVRNGKVKENDPVLLCLECSFTNPHSLINRHILIPFEEFIVQMGIIGE
jgi:hypothetical protein